MNQSQPHRPQSPLHDVEAILDYKTDEENNSRQLYKIKWKSTWEPLENLQTCRDLVMAFYHERIKERDSAAPYR